MSRTEQLLGKIENGTFGNYTPNLSDPFLPQCALGIPMPTLLGIMTKEGAIYLSYLPPMGGQSWQDHDEMLEEHGIRDTEFARQHESFVRFWVLNDVFGDVKILCRGEGWPSWWNEDVVIDHLIELGGTEQYAATARRMAIEQPDRARELDVIARRLIVQGAVQKLKRPAVE